MLGAGVREATGRERTLARCPRPRRPVTLEILLTVNSVATGDGNLSHPTAAGGNWLRAIAGVRPAKVGLRVAAATRIAVGTK